jgi:hypothetical protein
MGTPEVPLEQAHETIEHHAHGASEPWIMGVALTAAVLAALAAVTALYGEHFANEAMLEQVRAANKWNQFQANSTKEKVIETQKELYSELKKDPESAKLKELEKQLEKYTEGKKEAKKEAELLEEESNRHLDEHVPLSRGLTMFQVAIAIGAISVLTRRREFWFVCLAFGAVGVGFLIWGLAA